MGHLAEEENCCEIPLAQIISRSITNAVCAFRSIAGAQSTLIVSFLTNGQASGYNHHEGDTI